MNMKSGFTLIETLIAVTILTLSVVGPMITANRAIVASRTARDQLTASYLAQEGIEYMRAVRDNAYLAAYSAGNTSVAWSNFTTEIASCRTAPFCKFDPTGSGSLSVCSGGVCPLWLAPTNIYTPTSGGTQTPFTRTIQTVSVTATDEQVVSKVSWSYHGTPYSVTISDHLTPWQ